MKSPTEGLAVHDIGEKFRPRVLVVDNIESDVAQIVEQLLLRDYEPVRAASRVAAIGTLATMICDVALLDINLKDPGDGNNRDGLYVADYISRNALETKVIFISRPTYADADTLLRMFNRDTETGRRLAEAYVDKGDTQKVLDMVGLVLDGNTSRARFTAESSSWPEIERDLQKKVGADVSGEELIEAERQTVQILRRLGERELMQLSALKVDRVGRGRSRTVVVSMTARYRPTNNDVSSVVKIGDRTIVEAERLNYVKWVPSFVGLVSYPEMTGFAASRQLAGIGYSMLKESSRAPAPARTFVDRYWELSERESERVLDEVFLRMLVPKEAPRKADKGRTLRTAYLSRFRRLGAGNLHTQVDEIAEQSGIKAGVSVWSLPIGANTIKVAKPTEIFNTEFFNPYWVSVVHGDLHGENIIVMGEAAQPRPFLIDFAHIGEHHVFIDYAVMEVSVRFHLLGALLSETPTGEIEGLVKQWMEIERSLHDAAGPTDDSATLAFVDGRHEKLARLARLVLWLRRHARLQGFADTYYNYYGAVGMATLVAPFLPTFAAPAVRRAVRQALLGCAAFCLHRVRHQLKQPKPATPLSEALESPNAADSFAADVLRTNLRIEDTAKAACNAFTTRLSQPARAKAVDEAKPIVSRLETDLPKLAAELARVCAGFDNKAAPSALLPAQLFTFSSLIRDLGSSGPMAEVHEQTEKWIRSVWEAKSS